ncbi:MAG: energy transducer TonB [Bacteroidales bacterium]|jgi:protein TonB|nr:energy transducer TonB [Bacteroidales bacterium]
MELKKTERKNLENKKSLFFEIGLVVALSVAIFAFEYRSFDKGDTQQFVRPDNVFTLDGEVPITENTPPPPVDVPEQSTSIEFIIVDDIIEVSGCDIYDIFNPEKGNINPTIPKIKIPEDVLRGGDDDIFYVVEQQAEFPLEEGYMAYILKNLVYPDVARRALIEGQVAVEFIIEKDGSLTNIQILRDIGGGCGEELVRVLKGMPKWKPAMQRGKPVRNVFGMKVKFALSN